MHEFAPGGNPVLSLPDGVLRIGGISAALLRRNPLGAVLAELPPGYVKYTLEAGDTGTLAGASAPGANDLTLPAAEAALLRDIVRSAGLADRAPAALGEALKDYFSAGYTYSTFQEKAGTEHTPLARFLVTSHAGHCEYFATATVLLARAAGVPARYATGFSVQEYSRLEQAYVVRERHAHAWAQLYVGGRWLDVDTTPPTWIAIEDARAPRWRPLYDAASSWAKGSGFGASYWPATATRRSMARRSCWPWLRSPGSPSARAANRLRAAIPRAATPRGRRRNWAGIPSSTRSSGAWPGWACAAAAPRRAVARVADAPCARTRKSTSTPWSRWRGCITGFASIRKGWRPPSVTRCASRRGSGWRGIRSPPLDPQAGATLAGSQRPSSHAFPSRPNPRANKPAQCRVPAPVRYA